jgi:hypothetical protein
MSRVHSGRLSLSEGGGGGSVYQDIDGLTPGASYRISAWTLCEPHATAAARLAAYDLGSNVATFSQTARPVGTWQLLTHDVVVSPQGSIRIHLFRTQR